MIKHARKKKLIIFSLLGIEKDIKKPLLYEELIKEYAAKNVEEKSMAGVMHLIEHISC